MTTLAKLISISHMKQDTMEQLRTAAPAVVGTGLTWGLHEWNQWVSIGVGLATLLFIVIQAAYLLRRWYKREKHGWFTTQSPDTE